jgi:hypothetical protein
MARPQPPALVPLRVVRPCPSDAGCLGAGPYRYRSGSPRWDSFCRIFNSSPLQLQRVPEALVHLLREGRGERSELAEEHPALDGSQLVAFQHGIHLEAGGSEVGAGTGQDKVCGLHIGGQD